MTSNAQVCSHAERGVSRVFSAREAETRHLWSSHGSWYVVRRESSFVERCLGDVEACDSEDCRSRQLKRAKRLHLER